MSKLTMKIYLETRASLIFLSQRLLNRLRDSNTLLLPKPAPNNLHANRHPIHQIDIICKQNISINHISPTRTSTYTALD